MGINKITVDFLAIKVDILHQRPYYTIIYHPINSEKNSYYGNGSYSLYLVNEWLGKYFILKEKR